MNSTRPITVAILAMGGEGGGVLSDWLVNVAENNGHLAQATSVPGVAQRTGATIYYLELFPKSVAAAAGKSPILGLMPMAGDLDLVVASELMEAGRAVQRGFVTADRTHLIASTHRVYSIAERTAVADGRVDSSAILEGCEAAARKFIKFDMAVVAERRRTVISAVMLGAIAGTRCLPFPRESFEAAIRHSGVGVSASLAAFGEGYDTASGASHLAPTSDVGADLSAVAEIDERLALSPASVRPTVRAGFMRTADYQDGAYAAEYLERLEPFVSIAESRGAEGERLLDEVARQLALGMTYEDTIRVAELKTRKDRFDRVRTEVAAEPDQVLEIVEFMHPRLEEVADSLPAALGRWVLRNPLARRGLGRLTSKGRIVKTTSLCGFILLYGVASLKGIRRRTLRFQRETAFIDKWLDKVRQAAAIDLPLAVELARLRGLVKGYGETHERGLTKYNAIETFISARIGQANASLQLARLIAAAEKDERGAALGSAVEEMSARLKPEGLLAPVV